MGRPVPRRSHLDSASSAYLAPTLSVSISSTSSSSSPRA